MSEFNISDKAIKEMADAETGHDISAGLEPTLIQDNCKCCGLTKEEFIEFSTYKLTPDRLEEGDCCDAEVLVLLHQYNELVDFLKTRVIGSGCNIIGEICVPCDALELLRKHGIDV